MCQDFFGVIRVAYIATSTLVQTELFIEPIYSSMRLSTVHVGLNSGLRVLNMTSHGTVSHLLC